MDQRYGLHSAAGNFSGHSADFPATMISPLGYISQDSSAFFAGDDPAGAIRAKIASHPLYPKLVQAYIDCRKVGAPPEIAFALENIQRFEGDLRARSSTIACLGPDPELDDFMQAYCDVLLKYKSDISKPFEEATTFLHSMEAQLKSLCGGSSRSCFSEAVGVSEGGGGSSEEDYGGGEMETETTYTSDERELKDKLLRKYSGYISTLKLEFSKKKKKGKLPKEARQTLLDWWNIHFKWPYPTEADKLALSEVTGLDQKQINNWFINQRKRHWKPAENMQFAVIDNLYGGCGGGGSFFSSS